MRKISNTVLIVWHVFNAVNSSEFGTRTITYAKAFTHVVIPLRFTSTSSTSFSEKEVLYIRQVNQSYGVVHVSNSQCTVGGRWGGKLLAVGY